MRSLVSLALLLLLFPIYAQDGQDLVTKMESGDVMEIRLSPPGTMNKGSFTAANKITLGYWLYAPGTPETQKCPLIVYLHGSGMRGNNLDQVLVRGLPKYLVNTVDLPAVVLSPQCPSDRFWWDAKVGVALIELLHEITRMARVDDRDIVLTGHSMGGSGVWVLGAANPELFSRLLPISGQMKNSSADTYGKVPIWTFVAEYDQPLVYEINVNRTKELKELNGDVKMTLVRGTTHETVPSAVYTNVDALKWLLGK